MNVWRALAGAAVLSICWTVPGWAQQASQGMRTHHSGNMGQARGFSSSFSGSGIRSFMGDSYQLRQSQTSHNDILRANIGQSFGGARTRSTLPHFGASGQSGPLYTGGGGTNYLSGGPRSPYSSVLDVPTGFSGLGEVIVLPGEPNDLADHEHQMEWAVSAQQAVQPFTEKNLQRPDLTSVREDGPVLDPAWMAESVQATPGPTPLRSMEMTTPQGAVSAAQQLSRARDFVRSRQYNQAMMFYQAARSIDSSNPSSLVGIIYCHIMTGKFQAAGLNVLRLADQAPGFWMERPDFPAVFGISGPALVQQAREREPEIHRLIDIYRYRSETVETYSSDVYLFYLAKMFIAWIDGDTMQMETNVTLAGDFAPLDPEVQHLYRRITGQSQEQELIMTPLKPIY